MSFLEPCHGEHLVILRLHADWSDLVFEDRSCVKIILVSKYSQTLPYRFEAAAMARAALGRCPYAEQALHQLQPISNFVRINLNLHPWICPRWQYQGRLLPRHFLAGF
jgi:hypothetical protein